jgi:cephalosporin-C deacetylase-like acetyl esterase
MKTRPAKASRPDFDGKRFAVYGSSQGGGLSLILAGLNPRITAAAANVPALCDHAGYLAGRAPGWPRLVPQRAPEAERARYLSMSAYFDVVNFARRIRCPAIVSVGFVDSTCPPGSVYAAYNAIAAPKRMFHGPRTGHGSPPSFGKYCGRWLSGRLGWGKELPPKEADSAASEPRRAAPEQ